MSELKHSAGGDARPSSNVPDAGLTLSGADLTAIRAMVDTASEKGARRALRRLGLHDQNAGHDIRELRDLLDAWRAAKRTAWKTTIRWVITLIFAIALAGLATRLKIPIWDGP